MNTSLDPQTGAQPTHRPRMSRWAVAGLTFGFMGFCGAALAFAISSGTGGGSRSEFSTARLAVLDDQSSLVDASAVITGNAAEVFAGKIDPSTLHRALTSEIGSVYVAETADHGASGVCFFFVAPDKTISGGCGDMAQVATGQAAVVYQDRNSLPVFVGVVSNDATRVEVANGPAVDVINNAWIATGRPDSTGYSVSGNGASAHVTIPGLPGTGGQPIAQVPGSTPVTSAP